MTPRQSKDSNEGEWEGAKGHVRYDRGEETGCHRGSRGRGDEMGGDSAETRYV